MKIPALKYRPEVDGLRAVAVVPVILFHAGFESFEGGFLGVDVFFVISGYLITAIILSDCAAGRYSLAHFYERRARRILPPLFIVIAASIVMALLWMPPDAFVSFAESLVAASTFLSNVYFWRSTDYFSVASELNPLLHTWSLAVEEQFYILYPLVLVFAAQWGLRVLMMVLFGLLLGSFLFNQVALHIPSVSGLAVFYLTPFRGWQLLAGALCALVAPYTLARGSTFLSGVGLAAIILSISIFDKTTPTPSHFTVLPVAGTMLIILFCSPRDPVGRVLSCSPIVGIGLISYATYLWHQPIFAFARIRLLDEPGMWLMLSLSFLSLLLAWLTWKFVEQPVRHGKTPGLKTRPGVFAFSIAGLVAIAAVGVAGMSTNGLPARFSPDQIALLDPARNPNQGDCLHGDQVVEVHPRPGCADFLIDGRASVVFIGDSHADALAFPAQQMLFDNGIGSYAVFYYTCPPFSGLSLRPYQAEHVCDAYNRYMVAFAKSMGADTLVLSARFTQYLEGSLFDNGEGGVERRPVEMMDVVGFDQDRADPTDPERIDRVATRYQTALDALLAEFNVVLIDPVPEVGWDVPRYLLFRDRYGDAAISNPLTTSYAAYLSRNSRVIAAFEQVTSPRLRRVRPSAYLCNQTREGRCETEDNGMAYYYDDDHLSLLGAALLSQPILDAVVDLQGN
jgi:peptidoglycan/LPS O-acetylase OafA/YrhL